MPVVGPGSDGVYRRLSTTTPPSNSTAPKVSAAEKRVTTASSKVRISLGASMNVCSAFPHAPPAHR